MSPEDSAGGQAAVLDRWFAAFNAHDVEAMCELADPAIEMIPLADAETIPPGTSYRGHEGLRTLVTAGFERFPQLRLDHGRPQVRGSRVTVELEFVLDDGVEPPHVRTAVCDYRIRNGRIRLMRAYDPARSRRTLDDSDRASMLSPREREVLSLLAIGKTIPEIAHDLVLSPLTIRTHVRNAKDKLRARTTAHAVAIALDQHALDF